MLIRDQIDLQELQKTCALSLSLVDHHVLKKNDMFLKACVKEIFDHRPIDLSSKWDEERVKIRIEEVGSCTTLIADEILKKAPDMLDELLTQLLYGKKIFRKEQLICLCFLGVIVFDTIAFSSEAGKAKDLDVKITDELIKRFALQSNAKQIYQELWTAHNDVSKLSPKQLLYKDLKITEGIPLCGLPMLVLNYLKLGTEHLQGFTKELKTPVAILIGLETSPNGGVKRDIAIYDSKHNPELAQKIISELKANRELDLNEIIMELSNITYFTQNNVKLSRKFIAPIIKSTVLNVNAQNSHKM